MQVFNLTKVGKEVLQVFFGGFFVDVAGDDYPAFDAAHCGGVLLCFGIVAGGAAAGLGGGGVFEGVAGWGCGRIAHFFVGHDG